MKNIILHVLNEKIMGKIITQCPSCESINLLIAKIECTDCNTIFEGKFKIPTLLKLPSEDLKFIFDFVKCSGSLKEMAAKEGVSYPTLRNKLNLLIEALEEIEVEREVSKSDILQLLEDGKISAKDAAKMLYKL